MKRGPVTPSKSSVTVTVRKSGIMVVIPSVPPVDRSPVTGRTVVTVVAVRPPSRRQVIIVTVTEDSSPWAPVSVYPVWGIGALRSIVPRFSVPSLSVLRNFTYHNSS